MKQRPSFAYQNYSPFENRDELYTRLHSREKLLLTFVRSLRLSVRIQRGSHWTDFREIS